MSEWHGGALSLDQWAADLRSIIDAAQPAEPVTLLGISQGAATCVQDASRHPERVARLIFNPFYTAKEASICFPRRTSQMFAKSKLEL